MTPSSPSEAPSLEGLKAMRRVAIGLVLFLVGGFLAVAILIASLMPEEAGRPFTADLALAPGAEILRTEIGGDRLVLHVREGGAERLLIYDLRRGALLGVLTGPAP